MYHAAFIVEFQPLSRTRAIVYGNPIRVTDVPDFRFAA